MKVIEVPCPTFYSSNDENFLFTWLKQIDDIQEIKGEGEFLNITVNNVIKNDNLKELIALFKRYSLDMKPLHIFLTKKNMQWFQDKNKYWYKNIFEE